ncbi:hypothetical protein AGMMS49944_20950 [Spirochaetia bacterium]|nr:hypothetical protein AGMMS49944_20950 [Spirochaetia bacterium]
MKKSEIRALVCALVFLSGCAGTPPADTREAEAVAAANAALGAMNGQPLWVNTPEAVYPRNAFVSAVGSGNNRDQAEKSAFAALSSVFRQTLRADQTIATSFQEAVKNGAAASWIENTSVDSAIRTSTSMDLVGAEIREVWSDGKIFYAVAVMEKAGTAPVYTRMIQDNQKIIDTLIAVPASDRNSMDSLARFQFAATLAELNKVFANVLSVIGAPVPAGLKAPEDFRLEAANIMKTIPVSVTVQNDRDGRIRAAFTSALSAAGFRAGDTNSRYQLQARLSFTEVQLPGQTNKFTRYVIDGNFTNTSTGAVLFPYNINGREGHITLPEAENRAVKAAEDKIKGEYPGALTSFLFRLVPKK